MRIHGEHLIPGMLLGKDIKSKHGCFIQRVKSLPGGMLTKYAIRLIRNYGVENIGSHPCLIEVKEDKQTIKYIKNVLVEDIKKIAKDIESSKWCRDFLNDINLKDKVLLVIDELISKKDLTLILYSLRFHPSDRRNLIDLIYLHSIRVALIAIALGLKLKPPYRFYKNDLLNLGTAAILHHFGLRFSKYYPNLWMLDKFGPNELEDFVNEFKEDSLRFVHAQILDAPIDKPKVEKIVRSHLRPGIIGSGKDINFLLYIANLVDEMTTEMPYKIRFNFTPSELKIIGTSFSQQNGLIYVLLALIKLYKGKDFYWKTVSELVHLYSMSELLNEETKEKLQGYEKKLTDILELCPNKYAVAYPRNRGNGLPWTIYCNNSTDDMFYCKYLSQTSLDLNGSEILSKSFRKCIALAKRLHILNEEYWGKRNLFQFIQHDYELRL